MPKKVTFTKEIVFKKAFEVFDKQGLDVITARSLAKELKASPAPIYSNYESIDELKEELITVAKDRFIEYIQKPYTDLTFLNIGMGICIFARENKSLFSSIFLREQSFTDLKNRFKNLTSEEIKKDERFMSLPREFSYEVELDCWMYAHGYATMIATGFFKDPTNDEIKDKIMNGAAIMLYKKVEDFKNSQSQ